MIQTCKNPARKHCLYDVKKCYSAFDIYSKTNMSSALLKYFIIKPFDYCFSSLQSGMFEKRIVRASFKKTFEYYSQGFCTFGSSQFLITSGKEPNFLAYYFRRNQVCQGIKLERRSQKLAPVSPVLKENACVLHPVAGETGKVNSRPRTPLDGVRFFSRNRFWRRNVSQGGCKQTHQVLQEEHGWEPNSLRSLRRNPVCTLSIQHGLQRDGYQEAMRPRRSTLPPRNTKGQKKQLASFSALRVEKSKTFFSPRVAHGAVATMPFGVGEKMSLQPFSSSKGADQAPGIFLNNGLQTLHSYEKNHPNYSHARRTTMRGAFDNSKIMCPDWILETLIEQVKDRRNPRAVINQFLSNAHVVMRNLGCGSPVIGVQICASGRLSSRKKAMAQKIVRSIGTIPQSTLRRKVSYSQGFVPTRIGLLGIKIWVCYK